MCTLVFLKDVLSKRKELMKMNQITGIPQIPRIPEINCQLIWNEVKYISEISKFFPDIYINSIRIPDRTYLFTVD